MSASPAGGAGPTPNGTGPSAPRRRPPPKVNPLNPRHKPSKQIQRPRPAVLTSSTSEKPLPVDLQPKTFAAAPPSPTDSRAPTTVIPVTTTKRELLHGLRYHVARLISKDTVDVADPKEYERPVKLHRKDPRFFPNGSAVGEDSKDALVDEKERERLEAAKLERQRIREEHQKQMAPAAAQKKKPQAFKKKVEQVYRADDTPEERKRQQLRYEEALPWHIEDFDEKKVWQGSYEAALSECYAMLVKTDNGSFRLVPLEKWYRFRQKATQKEHMDVEKAEAQMAKGQRAPRWLLKNEIQQKQLKKEEAAWGKQLFARSGDKEVTRGSTGLDFGDEPEADPDANDIDFNVEEEFADDEENELFEGDEDTKKAAEDRLKRDQLEAGVFDLKDETKVEAEEERKRAIEELRKKLEKGTRKTLVKREKDYNYESDSDGNPYSSESESIDSETERQRDEERAKEEEAKVKQDTRNGKVGSKDGTKPPSGASSRGTNTPAGRKEKHGDTSLRKVVTSAQKRPGSPMASDQSGNESSRTKRIKKHHAPGTGTPRPGVSSANISRHASFVVPAGSGSDTDSRGPRLKVRLSGAPPGTSPRDSRAGSPAASDRLSHAASPPAGSGSPSQVTELGPPTGAEIAAKIPKEGITLKELSAIFRARVNSPGNDHMRVFIAEVRRVGNLDPATKKLFLKN